MINMKVPMLSVQNIFCEAQLYMCLMCSLIPGRGVVTTEEFDNGDFLLQYPGKLLPESVAEALEEDEGHPSVFRYFFSFKGKTSW